MHEYKFDVLVVLRYPDHTKHVPDAQGAEARDGALVIYRSHTERTILPLWRVVSCEIKRLEPSEEQKVTYDPRLTVKHIS